MKPKWNRASLKKAIKALILREDLVIRQRELKHNPAMSTWRKDGDNIVIFCDLHRDGLITVVIHELLHIALQKEMEVFTYEVEEPQIAALEQYIFKHVRESQAQMRWWRKHIQARIKGG